MRHITWSAGSPSLNHEGYCGDQFQVRAHQLGTSPPLEPPTVPILCQVPHGSQAGFTTANSSMK